MATADSLFRDQAISGSELYLMRFNPNLYTPLALVAQYLATEGGPSLTLTPPWEGGDAVTLAGSSRTQFGGSSVLAVQLDWPPQHGSTT